MTVTDVQRDEQALTLTLTAEYAAPIEQVWPRGIAARIRSSTAVACGVLPSERSARECSTVLGPAGYAGVQVAPPQNSVKRTALGNGSDTPCCTRGGRSTSRSPTTSPPGWAPRRSSAPWCAPAAARV